MFGNERQAGLLARSIAFILNAKPLSVSFVENIANEFFDLISGKKEKISKIGEEKKRALKSASEFDILLTQILKLRTQKSTDENATSSRSHLLISFEDGKNGKLAFIDLAGWESPNGKENINETKFINASLTSLNTALEHITKKMTPSFCTPLAKMFRPYLSQSAKTCMLYHVSSAGAKKGLENIKNVVASNKAIPLKGRNSLMDITNIHKKTGVF